MSWERDPLWAKAKLFFERAFHEDRDDPRFGLWCSLALELLARAALSSISPALLAAPEKNHKNLIHALGLNPDISNRRSIGAVQVFTLCQSLFEQFTADDFGVSISLLGRRNEELHSGSSAFEAYPPRMWLSRFYRACQSLSEILDESLDTLFGEEEAKAAEETRAESMEKVKSQVQSKIATHRKVFESKGPNEQEMAKQIAIEAGQKLAFQRHHRVDCPACGCVATVQGEVFGQEKVTSLGDVIVVRQPVAPRKFECTSCGLRLNGYAQLEEAGLGGHYTRKTEYSPEEYYDLIDPEYYDPRDYMDMEELAREYLEERYHEERFGWDNE